MSCPLQWEPKSQPLNYPDACLTTNSSPQAQGQLCSSPAELMQQQRPVELAWKNLSGWQREEVLAGAHSCCCRIAWRVPKFSAQHRLSGWLCWLAFLSLIFLICCKELGVLFASKWAYQYPLDNASFPPGEKQKGSWRNTAGIRWSCFINELLGIYQNHSQDVTSEYDVLGHYYSMSVLPMSVSSPVS